MCPAPEPAPGAPPRRIGRYEIRRLLGRGGMGEVYLARDPQLDRDVAVKVLLAAAHATPEDLARFKTEAQTAARLDHPAIVRTYEFGEADGVHYLAQEFVDGTSLDRQVDEEPPSPRRAMEILATLADAVQAAHAQGVIHRDLKPANVLLDRAGNPKLTDFGLARRVGSAQLTRSGAILGTPAYMAPEQAMAKSDEIDARTDVYGLGAVLYELLTLEPPFGGGTPMEVIFKLLRHDVVPPERRDRRISPEISAICRKCLEKRPGDRYPSAAALAEDCRRYLRGEPVLARPAGPLRRTWRRALRHRAMVGVAAAAGTLGLAATGAVYWQYAVRPVRAERAAAAASATAQAAAVASASTAVAAAQAALAAGRDVEARAAAARLLVEAVPTLGADGPPVAVEAQLVLAEVARRTGERPASRQALLAAHALARGAADAPALDVRIGDLLYRSGEPGLAEQTYGRALAAASGEAARAARLGLARCAASRLELAESASRFEACAGEPGQDAAAAAEIAAWRGLLDLLRPARPWPEAFERPMARDLDGDGVPEVLALADGALHVGRVRDGAVETAGPVELFATGERRHPIQAVDVLDADGDGRVEILLAGGDVATETGSLFVLAWRDGRAVVTARLPLGSAFTAQPFAVADVEGDGQRELVVGTDNYDRSIRLYRLEAGGTRLRLLRRTFLNGNVYAVTALDRDGDGRDELWCLIGAWGEHACSCLRLAWDPAADDFRRAAQPFAVTYAVDRSARAGDPDLLVAAGWQAPIAASLQRRIGRAAFEQRYRPEGAYLLRFDAAAAAITPLTTLPFTEMDPRYGPPPRACRLRGPGGSYAWTWIQRRALAGSDEPYRIQLFHDAGPWRLLGEAVTWEARFAHATSADLDGDGDDELVAGRRVFGLRGPGVVADRPVPPPSGGEPPPPSLASPVLREAREARRLGILDIAADRYRAELARPASEESLREAAQGWPAALVAMGRLHEAADAAEAVIARFPFLGEEVSPGLVGALAGRGEWARAAPFVRALLRSGRRDADERRAWREILAQGEALERLAPLCAVAGTAPAAVEWLATSPFVAVAAADGSVRLFAAGVHEGDVLAVACRPPRGSLRVRAAFTPVRQEWHTRFEIGLATGSPWGLVRRGPGRWFLLDIECHGAVDSPVVTTSLRGVPDTELATTPRAIGGRVEATLEYAAGARRLRADLRPAGGAVLTRAATEVEAPPGGPELLYFRGVAGASGEAHATVLDLHQLTLEAEPGEVAPPAAMPGTVPATAGWQLARANGRWIQGRLAEALAGYDAACAAAEEAADPDAPGAAVDARLFRGLLRARLGQDAAAVTADLAAADRLDPARVSAFIVRSARALAGREAEVAALAQHLRTKHAALEGGGEFHRWLMATYGRPAAEALLPGVGIRLVATIEVKRLEAADAREAVEGPLAAGDVLVRYDGRAVDDPWALDDLQDAARTAGRPVEVEARRGGEARLVTLDPTRVWIVPQTRLSLERR